MVQETILATAGWKPSNQKEVFLLVEYQIPKAVQEDLRKPGVMEVNTLKKTEKVIWLWALRQVLARGNSAKDLVGEGARVRCWATHLAEHYYEPKFSWAAFGARHKAYWLNNRTPPEVLVS